MSPGVLLLVLGSLALPGIRPQERARPLTLVVQVDCARARELVWTLADASDQEVRDTAARIVRKRLRALGKSATVSVDHEQGRLAVALERAVDSSERELLEGLLRSMGLCEFFIVLEPEHARHLGIDLAAERSKLETWRAANPTAPLEAFNVIAEPMGPHARMSWVTVIPAMTQGKEALGWPVLLPGRVQEVHGATSFERTSAAQDALGFPAIAYELRPARAQAFADFSERHLHQRLAIVMGGQLVSAPELETRLPGSGLIEGRFDAEAIEGWVAALRDLSGPLRVVEIR